MHGIKLLVSAILLTASTSVNAASAPIAKGNSVAKYAAIFDGAISGSITFQTPHDKIGMAVDVSLKGLPEGLGPFPYHIHLLPVPADGNCNGTAGHLNPYNGTYPAPSPTDPSLAEVGDLAGKHGSIPDVPSYSTSYVDLYLSDNDSNPAYIGNRSIVIHSQDLTRLACADINEIPCQSND
ncbi:superoxide dismutase [Dipodascopsis uninucleata]